jgi:hypothetical protein
MITAPSWSVARNTLACATVLVLGCSNPTGPLEFSVQSTDSPAGVGSSEPHLAVGTDGTVVLSWLQSFGATEVELQFAVLGKEGWGGSQTVRRGSNWFINWADFPSVEPLSDDLWAAHWLVKREGGVYAYDVAIALSTDRGQSWSEAIMPHDDGTATEHGFVTLFPWQDHVGAVWLDGRNMKEDVGHDAGEHGEGGPMSLRSALIGSGGNIDHPRQIDPMVCDCCQTDVAVTTAGPVAIYRDRTTAEIRDISVARAVEGEWQAPVTLGEDRWWIPACPVNGPAIAGRDDRLAAVWLTATPERKTKVKAAYSTDGGQSFSPEIIIDDQRPMGRVDVVMLPNHDVIVSWLRRTNEGKAELRIRRLSSSGDLDPSYVIIETGDSRPFGFPQMVLAGTELVFAWTDASGDELQVRTAKAKL